MMRSPVECDGLWQGRALSPTGGRISAGCTAVDVALGDIWYLRCLASHLPLRMLFTVTFMVGEHMTSGKVGNPTVACTTN